jgi:hypothetical protein
MIITVFTVFRLLTDFVCLYTYEFWLYFWKIVRSSVILLLSSFTLVYIFLICIPHNNCIFTVAFWSRDWRLRLTLLVVLTMDDSIPINNVGTVPTLRYNDCHKTFCRTSVARTRKILRKCVIGSSSDRSSTILVFEI